LDEHPQEVFSEKIEFKSAPENLSYDKSFDLIYENISSVGKNKLPD